jgi:hypothetical protein
MDLRKVILVFFIFGVLLFSCAIRKSPSKKDQNNSSLVFYDTISITNPILIYFEEYDDYENKKSNVVLLEEDSLETLDLSRDTLFSQFVSKYGFYMIIPATFQDVLGQYIEETNNSEHFMTKLHEDLYDENRNIDFYVSDTNGIKVFKFRRLVYFKLLVNNFLHFEISGNLINDNYARDQIYTLDNNKRYNVAIPMLW